MNIKDVLDEIAEELEHADPRRPDYCHNVEIERLRNWHETITSLVAGSGGQDQDRRFPAGKPNQGRVQGAIQTHLKAVPPRLIGPEYGVPYQQWLDQLADLIREIEA